MANRKKVASHQRGRSSVRVALGRVSRPGLSMVKPYRICPREKDAGGCKAAAASERRAQLLLRSLGRWPRSVSAVLGSGSWAIAVCVLDAGWEEETALLYLGSI